MRRRRRNPFFWLALILLAVIFIGPIVLMVLTAFKTRLEAQAVPPTILPQEWTVGAFEILFQPDSTTPVLRWFLNSMVAATGHLGAWELEAGMLGEFFTSRPRLVVVRRYRSEPINRLVTELRGGRGATVLGHRDAIFPVLRGLRKGGVAAFLVDHNASRSEAIFLPFFGKAEK